MMSRRRRSDVLGKVNFPYGAPEVQHTAAVPFKDRATDEVAWRRKMAQVERRKVSTRRAVPPPVQPTARPIKAKRADARLGYNPYESGELVRHKNPGVKRNLRELGQWLMTRPARRK